MYQLIKHVLLSIKTNVVIVILNSELGKLVIYCSMICILIIQTGKVV